MRIQFLNISFIISFICSFKIVGQDIHWSQFNANPIFLNPANSGRFDGDYRFIANRRNQWKSVTEPFTTTSLSADKILKNSIGLGILFFDDVAGDGKFRTNEFHLNTSYKFNLTKDSSTTLHIGSNLGINHRQINWDLLSFDNQYNGIIYNPNLPTNEQFINQKKTNFTFGIGATFLKEFEQFKIELSSGIFNLNRPNQGFYNEKIKRDLRNSTALQIIFPFREKFELQPNIHYQIQGKYHSLLIGTNFKYQFKKTSLKYIALYSGGWIRNNDALIFSLGADYQNWFFGLSYDINTSTLIQASNYRGGTEFAIRYILKRYKPKQISYRICPDYI